MITREFPDYDTDTLPPIPVAWEDTSWHNDASPSWRAPNGLRIFVDYADETMREVQGCPRFVVQHEHDGDVIDILASDDWNQILTLVLAAQVQP